MAGGLVLGRELLPPPPAPSSSPGGNGGALGGGWSFGENQICVGVEGALGGEVCIRG